MEEQPYLLNKESNWLIEFKTREQFKAAMSEYIEYYNNERTNTKRKGLSPLAYRQQSFQDLALI